MCMAEIEKKIREMRQLQALVAEAEEEIESIKDELKAQMDDRVEMCAGEYKIIWQPVTQKRLDTAALKKALGAELLAAYTREVTTRPFRIV